MKLGIKLISLLLFMIPQVSFGGGIEQTNCKNSETLVSLVDYSYCIPKKGLESFRVLGGKHTTVHIVNKGIEYSFAKIPTSLAILDIPEKTGISLTQFFQRLINTNHIKNGYSDIRSAFDIKESTIVSNYTNKGISAYYIINEGSINNSIYLLNDSEEYIYVVKGAFGELFARRFLSGLQYVF